jgi:ABC-2 type transport system ATP-binding protein
MRHFLRTLAAQGRAILVSSHLMSELQDIADHLVVVGRGQVIAATSVADLIAAASGNRILLRTADPGPRHRTARPGRRRGHCHRTRRAPPRRHNGRTGCGAPHCARHPVTEISAQKVSLEQAYLDLTAGAVEYKAVR